jgi:hypothetical protein
MYGNPKIHKNDKDPPLRPIISTIPTPTYEISKTINGIISKYIPDNFSIKSTNEFLELIRS